MNESESLKQRIEMLEREMDYRRFQQIRYPLDETSKQIITEAGTLNPHGLGTATTQVVNVSGGGGGTVTVPAQPSGTIKVFVNGVEYELLYK